MSWSSLTFPANLVGVSGQLHRWSDSPAFGDRWNHEPHPGAREDGGYFAVRVWPWADAVRGPVGAPVDVRHDGRVTTTIRLAVIDDHRAVSEGVPAGLLGLIDLAEPCVQAKTVDELEAKAGAGFDVVILDVRLSDDSEPEDNVRRLCGHGWNVLLYTREPRPAVLARCMDAGAKGIVGKHEDWPVLADAVSAVARGMEYVNADWACAVEAMNSSGRFPALSPRELECIQLYAAGLPAKSVARRMAISEDTVKEHLRRARRKYTSAGRPTYSKTELFRRAIEDGYYLPDLE